MFRYVHSKLTYIYIYILYLYIKKPKKPKTQNYQNDTYSKAIFDSFAGQHSHQFPCRCTHFWAQTLSVGRLLEIFCKNLAVGRLLMIFHSFQYFRETWSKSPQKIKMFFNIQIILQKNIKNLYELTYLFGLNR